MPCWYFDKEHLSFTPSRRDGVDAATEAHYRKEGVRLIFGISQGLQMYLFVLQLYGWYFVLFFLRCAAITCTNIWRSFAIFHRLAYIMSQLIYFSCFLSFHVLYVNAALYLVSECRAYGIFIKGWIIFITSLQYLSTKVQSHTDRLVYKIDWSLRL